MNALKLVAGVLVAGHLISPLRAEATPNIGKLSEKLGPGNGDVARRSAAEALGKAGESAGAAVPALLKTLGNDPDTAVRLHSAWALGKIKNPAEATVPGLIAALADADWGVRHNAMLSLSWIGKPAVGALKAAVGDENAVKRVYALHALLIVDPSLAGENMPKILELLQHENPGVKNCAAAAAGGVGEAAKAAVPGLMALLDEKDSNLRHQAMESLARIGPAAVPALPRIIELLKTDKEKWNRIGAALALGSMGKGHKDAIEALIAAFNDKDARVRSYSASSLGQIGESAAPALEEATKSEDARFRRHALIALAIMGEQAKSAVNSLVVRLEDSDEEVRSAAADALGAIGSASKEVKQALEKARDAEKSNTPLRAHMEQALVMLNADKQAAR